MIIVADLGGGTAVSFISALIEASPHTETGCRNSESYIHSSG